MPDEKDKIEDEIIKKETPVVKLEEMPDENETPSQKEIRIEDIEGLPPLFSSAPTHVPKNYKEQGITYHSGTTYRYYKWIKDAFKLIYDSTWGILTSTQLTDLTDGGATTLHKHDHGGQDGLTDDDHTIYTKADGTRAFTGEQSMGSNKLTNVTDPASAQDAATKNYVDTNKGYSSRARAYLTGSDQTIGTGLVTKVTLSGEDYDGDSEFDSDTDYDFTATTAGYYLVQAAVTYAGITDEILHKAMIYKNAASAAESSIHSGKPATLTIVISTTLYLAANDTVSLYTQHENGDNRDISQGSNLTFLSIHRLS